eukprot:jgi/Mesen1/10295/ME000079S09721
MSYGTWRATARANLFVALLEPCGRLWRGFLATSLSSVDLLYFAFMTFVIAPNSLRFRLVKHLIVDPSGSDLIKTYLGLNTRASQQQAAIPATVASSFLLVLAAAQYSQPPVE